VWNDLCMEVFENVRLGELFYVDNYKVSIAKDRALGFKVSLNPSSPRAIINKFPG